MGFLQPDDDEHSLEDTVNAVTNANKYAKGVIELTANLMEPDHEPGPDSAILCMIAAVTPALLGTIMNGGTEEDIQRVRETLITGFTGVTDCYITLVKNYKKDKTQ